MTCSESGLSMRIEKSSRFTTWTHTNIDYARKTRTHALGSNEYRQWGRPCMWMRLPIRSCVNASMFRSIGVDVRKETASSRSPGSWTQSTSVNTKRMESCVLQGHFYHVLIVPTYCVIGSLKGSITISWWNFEWINFVRDHLLSSANTEWFLSWTAAIHKLCLYIYP